MYAFLLRSIFPVRVYYALTCMCFRRHGKVEGRGDQQRDGRCFHWVTFPFSLFSVSLRFSPVGVAALRPWICAFPPSLVM